MRLLYAMLALGSIVALALGTAAAAPASSHGAAIANACATCHGPDGQSQGKIPSLRTLSTKDFIAALKAFRAGTRAGTVMHRIAAGLDDADIEAVAGYFATLQKR
jgi:sulfide dehydrogenase cytochrome subunit